MRRQRQITGTTIGLVAVLLAGCSSGPSTKAEVCSSFDSLGTKLMHANGILDNGIFDEAGNLGDTAGRYQGADLSRDASALKKIADSSSTSGAALMNATGEVANLCGHPLALNALFGN
jgi:hypothetical protein